jgi:hypothetical protein
MGVVDVSEVDRVHVEMRIHTVDLRRSNSTTSINL